VRGRFGLGGGAVSGAGATAFVDTVPRDVLSTVCTHHPERLRRRISLSARDYDRPQDVIRFLKGVLDRNSHAGNSWKFASDRRVGERDRRQSLSGRLMPGF
jgi:hypothetical protein